MILFAELKVPAVIFVTVSMPAVKFLLELAEVVSIEVGPVRLVEVMSVATNEPVVIPAPDHRGP
jgi:hypothetical protein